MIDRRAILFVLVSAGVTFGCAAEESAPLGVDDPDGTLSLAKQIEGRYEGDWTIEIKPDIGVLGVCPGHVVLRAETLKERLLGSAFTGTYFIDAAGDCVGGSTVSGEVINGTLREDGGVNFGLDVPRSDGNFFEDVLAGSGVNLGPLERLGCTLTASDLNNHMDGSIVSDRLRAANSAGLSCASTPGDTIAMRVSIDATR